MNHLYNTICNFIELIKIFGGFYKTLISFWWYLVSDSVMIEKSFKLGNFFFRIKGENAHFYEGFGCMVENKQQHFTGHLGHIFLFLSSGYTWLQKLHHLSERVACATDNCKNAVNHFVPIKLTCIIIIAGKHVYLIPPENVHLTYSRLSRD